MESMSNKPAAQTQFARHDSPAIFSKKTLKTIDNIAQASTSREWRVLDAKYLGALLIGYAAEKCEPVQFDVQLIDDWRLNQIQR